MPLMRISRSDCENSASPKTLPYQGAPICRWRQKQTILDLLPLDENILGFSNRWYKPAMEFAQDHQLGPGLRIRVVTAVYFCATKLEAFRRRGKGDYLSSHDLEDLISVVDGRLELVDEMQVAPEEVRLTSLSKSRNCSTSDLLWMRYRATFFRMRPIKSGSRRSWHA